MMTARFRFLSAPATIPRPRRSPRSPAPRWGRRRRPRPRAPASPRAACRTGPRWRRWCPWTRKVSETWMACSSRPPGLPRMSSTRPLRPPLASACLRMLGERRLEVAGGVALEVLQPHVADVAARAACDCTDSMEMIARVSVIGLRLVPALALHGDGDLRVHRAAQLGHGLVEVHVDRGLLADLLDLVVLLDARAVAPASWAAPSPR